MNLTASTSARNLILVYLLFGAGWALIIPASFGIALASLPQEMGGVGMGSIGTFHNFGGTVGLALAAGLGFFGALGLILATSLFVFLVILFIMKQS